MWFLLYWGLLLWEFKGCIATYGFLAYDNLRKRNINILRIGSPPLLQVLEFHLELRNQLNL
jgi:hypothetical protein